MTANQGPFRFLVNHNPFYLISTLLLLYGLQIATDSGASIHEHKLAAIFCGVIVLMAVTAIAIVRLGGVWDDTRTILLSIMLLLVGVTIGYDSEVMVDRGSAAKILGGGLVFGILVWELLLWALRIRLPVSFRVPVYLMHAVFFLWSLIFVKAGTPNWLGTLSPSWRVYLFGWAFAAIMLMCVPVVWRGRNVFRNNGTPWKWPLFPWSILVILVAAACVRLYMFSLAFIPEFGWESPLAWHFFMPIFFAAYVLVVELANSFFPRIRNVYLCAAIPVLMLAMPWPAGEMSTFFLEDVSLAIGNPLWLALMMVVAFGVTLWIRGHHEVEFGVQLFLLGAVFVYYDRPEISATPVSAIPVIALSVFHAVRAWRVASSARLVLSLAFATIAAWILLPAESYGSQFAWAASAHLVWIGILLIGIFYRDRFAARLRVASLGMTCVMAGVATVGALAGRWPGWAAILYIVILQLTMLTCWQWNAGRLFSRVAIILSLGWPSGLADLPGLMLWNWLGDRSGMLLLFAGLCFLLGLVISCSKAGWLNWLKREWLDFLKGIQDELEVISAADV